MKDCKVFRVVKDNGSTPVLIEKAIAQNGEYVAADDNADGYSKVVVNVVPQKTDLAKFIEGDVFEEITPQLLNGLTKVRPRAFSYAASAGLYLLKKIELPDSVTSVDERGLADVGASAFEIIIGAGVVTIGKFACVNNNTTSITVKAVVPPELLTNDAFVSTNNCPIYVPAQSVDAYKVATNWSAVASRIQAIPT